MWEMGIQYPVLDSNIQPLARESHPITTRPRLPPKPGTFTTTFFLQNPNEWAFAKRNFQHSLGPTKLI